MPWDPNTARPEPYSKAVSDVAARILRPRARARIRPAGQRDVANMLASFGMIGGLLLFWAVVTAL